MTYTEKTHAAFGDQPINTADAKTLAWLIRRVPAGGERPQKREGLMLGLILAAMTAQYFL